MHVLWKGLDKGLLLLSELSSLEHILLELLNLGIRWELSSEEQPQNTLWNWLPPRNGLWGLLSDLEKIVPSVGNTVNRVEL